MNINRSRESGLISWKHPTNNPCKEERSGPLINWGTGERTWKANAEIRDWGWFLRSDFSEDVWYMIQKPTEGTTFYLSGQTSLEVQHPSEDWGRQSTVNTNTATVAWVQSRSPNILQQFPNTSALQNGQEGLWKSRLLDPPTPTSAFFSSPPPELLNQEVWDGG